MMERLVALDSTPTVAMSFVSLSPFFLEPSNLIVMVAQLDEDFTLNEVFKFGVFYAFKSASGMLK